MTPKLALNADIVIGAEGAKQVYDGFIRAGFTKKEAFRLLEVSLHGSAIGSQILAAMKKIEKGI